MRNIGEEIEDAIFTVPANQDTYGLPSVFLRLNRAVTEVVWTSIGRHVDEDKDDTRHQWYTSKKT